MPRLNLIQHAAASVCGASLMAVGSQARADVTLTSSDGRWSAAIETDGGAAGQCNGMSDMLQPVEYRSFLANTRHYVRMGTSLSYANAVSQPMQNHFHLLSFANSSDNYTAVLASNSVPGLIAIVHGEMIAGAAGGLRVSLSFADTAPADSRIRPDSNPLKAKTIESSAPQVAPEISRPTDAIVTGGPPASGTLRNVKSLSSLNATHLLSCEKNGWLAPTVPGSSFGSLEGVWFKGRM